MILVKYVKFHGKILILCCFIAMALLPVQATAFPGLDDLRNTGAGGNTFHSVNPSISSHGYSSVKFPSGLAASRPDDTCLCSTVDFEYIEDNQTDVNRPKLWSTRLGLLPFPLGNSIPGPFGQRIQSYNTPSFL